MTEFKPATFIRLDLFPAQIVEASNPQEVVLVSTDMRIIVTNDMVYIFKEGLSGIDVHFSAWLGEFTGSNKEGYTITTGTGETFLVHRAQNCGCGSRLRAFFPFPGVPFISQLR